MQKTQAVDEVRMDEIAALLEKFKESGLAFDDLLVRKVVETIQVESAEKLEVTFKDGNRRVVALPERGVNLSTNIKSCETVSSRR